MLERFPLLSVALLILPPSVSQEPDEGRETSAVSSPLRSSAWMKQVEGDIARSEYSWSSARGGVSSAPNRSNHLRSLVGADGLEVFPRETARSGVVATWRLMLRTIAFGWEGDACPPGEPSVARFENRIELHYAALDEWYVNDECGVEQGWTIPAPVPECERSSLSIEIEVSGLHAEISGDGHSADFVDDAAAPRLRYEDLRAWDAAGCDLPARLIPTSSGFAIRVESEDALYPITVDPVLGPPAWTAEGDQITASFGTSVSGAGDVNGDGYDDVIVGAPSFDAGEQSEGRAYVYLGSANGLSLTADWTVESNQVFADFGWSVCGAGDVNGDGFDDVIVGAHFFDNGQSNEGRAYLYLGSAGGPSLVPDWTVESDQASAAFGFSVAGAGDLNGDGFDDLVVGANRFDNGEMDEGRAYVYLGSASGPSLVPDWTAESDQVNALFGSSVCGAGDVNGDGFDDLLVGAPFFENGELREGRAHLYLGSPGGPSLVPDWTVESDQVDAMLGSSVSRAGDVNGDGFDDVIVGAPSFENGETGEGRAFVYLGSSSGPSLVPDWMAEGNSVGAEFGSAVSTASDIDGDGFDDLIIGARGFTDIQSQEGRAYVYLGSSGGPLLSPGWSVKSNKSLANFGHSVSAAGDVDADGFDDVIVGAPGFSSGEPGEGRAFVYLGCEPVGTRYCIATANSTGSPAELSAWCSASSGAGKLRLDATPVPSHHGIFFHGANQVQVPFGNGFLCTSAAIGRGVVLKVFADLATYTYDNSDPKHSLRAFVGATRNFQYWFRDPAAGGAFFNTSDAVSIVILP
jgi:hypothetical protein